VGLDRQQDCRLEAVGVLVFVDEDVVEARADIGGDGGFAHHHGPVEQQVVVVEDVLGLLGFDVGGKQLAELGLPHRGPGKMVLEGFGKLGLRVDGARIDGEAGPLGGEAGPGVVEAEVVADDVEEIGRVLAVVNGELLVEPKSRRIFAQQARADAVERTGPVEGLRDGAARGAHDLRRDALDAPGHLAGGAAREGHQQDAARIGAVDDEVGDAMGEGVGLARARAGDDQQRTADGAVADAVLNGTALLGVQTLEVIDLGEHGESGRVGVAHSEPYSRFVHKA